MKYRFGEFVLDGGTRQLLRDGIEVHLSPKAFDLLALLLEARPRMLSKSQLHERLWPDTFVTEANLAMLVVEIRAAIDDNAKAPRFIRTVQRHGYAFHGDAAELTAPDLRAQGFACWLLAPLRQIPLVAGANIVGRDPAAQAWIDADGVSRQHARITVDAGTATIEDLNSKNGTRVRGQRITGPVQLADGDEIQFGSTAVMFRVWSDRRTLTERLE